MGPAGSPGVFQIPGEQQPSNEQQLPPEMAAVLAAYGDQAREASVVPANPNVIPGDFSGRTGREAINPTSPAHDADVIDLFGRGEQSRGFLDDAFGMAQAANEVAPALSPEVPVPSLEEIKKFTAGVVAWRHNALKEANNPYEAGVLREREAA